ncbi:MAG: glycosyltransferase family 2 protein [Planctomycetota bacterium]
MNSLVGDQAGMVDYLPGVSAVISTWNRIEDLRANLNALRKQTWPIDEIIVVDNASSDNTAERVRNEFPDVRLLVMPDSSAGACETFNVGFKAVRHKFTIIMDDDVVAPPDWLERIMKRFEVEPSTTGMISSKVVEPNMPESFTKAESVNTIRYISTFRGCGTVALSDVIRRAGYYDEKFFIYGNERDLSARVMNLGYRILQFPLAELFHRTPFGMRGGNRSIYYHTRNYWLYAFKNCKWVTVFCTAFKLGFKGLGLYAADENDTNDATGTIGLSEAIHKTPGGLWSALTGTLAAFCLLPYCLRNRKVCKAPDFKPPLS